jgi:hypothetical protein
LADLVLPILRRFRVAAIALAFLYIALVFLSPWPPLVTIRHVLAAPSCDFARLMALAPARLREQLGCCHREVAAAWCRAWEAAGSRRNSSFRPPPDRFSTGGGERCFPRAPAHSDRNLTRRPYLHIPLICRERIARAGTEPTQSAGGDGNRNPSFDMRVGECMRSCHPHMTEPKGRTRGARGWCKATSGTAPLASFGTAPSVGFMVHDCG